VVNTTVKIDEQLGGINISRAFTASDSPCNPIPQSATPATRDYFLIKGNKRKKKKNRPSRKILSKSHPSPAGIRFWGEEDLK
jgi:hypothetical protein